MLSPVSNLKNDLIDIIVISITAVTDTSNGCTRTHLPLSGACWRFSWPDFRDFRTYPLVKVSCPAFGAFPLSWKCALPPAFEVSHPYGFENVLKNVTKQCVVLSKVRVHYTSKFRRRRFCRSATKGSVKIIMFCTVMFGEIAPPLTPPLSREKQNPPHFSLGYRADWRSKCFIGADLGQIIALPRCLMFKS